MKFFICWLLVKILDLFFVFIDCILNVIVFLRVKGSIIGFLIECCKI